MDGQTSLLESALESGRAGFVCRLACLNTISCAKELMERAGEPDS